jgi:hemin uptake protein HemP
MSVFALPSTLAHPAAHALFVSGSRPVSRPALRISSQELLKQSRELVIEHAGEEYRLKLTRNNKLILNK